VYGRKDQPVIVHLETLFLKVLFLVHYFSFYILNDVPRLTQGRTIMYADDMANELQKTTSHNTVMVEQYLKQFIYKSSQKNIGRKVN
jgi:hypothetical protein